MENKMEKAAARPWQVVKLDDNYYIQHGDGTKVNSGHAVRTNCKEYKANAELIVRAVNSYDALLEACRESIAYLDEAKIKAPMLRSILESAINQAEAAN